MIDNNDNLLFSPNESVLDTAYNRASTARNDLTCSKCIAHEEQYIHFAKVCCFCDRLLRHGQNKWIPIKWFSTKKKLACAFDRNNYKDEFYGMNERVWNRLKDGYKQRYFIAENDDDAEITELNKMILSPRSFGRKNINKRELGCCKECKSAVDSLCRRRGESKLPQFCIANGLMIGTGTSRILRELNEVEVALISLARTEKHLFTITAGAHKEIKGWHTMYANEDNLTQTGRVMNFLRSENNNRHRNNEGGTGLSHNRDPRNNNNNDTEIRINQESNESNLTNSNNEGDESRESNPNNRRVVSPISCLDRISVILTGPFTNDQLNITKKRTEVRPAKVIEALHWLTANNVLYKDIEVPQENDIALPRIIKYHEVVDSVDSNIETVFEIHSVFDDDQQPSAFNGGYRTAKEFKDVALDQLTKSDADRKYTLISRPSSERMRDYVDDNLMKAFPLQFPYGIGNKDRKGEKRCGTKYMQYLLNHSRPDFHRADFVVVVHNIWERQKMVSSAHFRVSDADKSEIGDIKNEDLIEAIENHLEDGSRSESIDMFLKKLDAVTGSMAHSSEAAKRARNYMYATITRFGLPAMLFTITPDDEMNFRIKIMVEEETIGPPSPRANDLFLKEFVVGCAKRRVEYPGLCAFDFENIIDITIEHFLGWNINKGENVKNTGLFGDLNGWCYAVEEQGRKTLHAHFLLWVKNWDKILDRLRDPDERDGIKELMENYARNVMKATYGDTLCAVKCDGDDCTCQLRVENVLKCTDQDIRNLRTQQNCTSLGGRSTFACDNCEKRYSPNNYAKLVVDQSLLNHTQQRDGTVGGSTYFDENELWFKAGRRSKRKAQMALEIMNEQVADKKEEDYRRQANPNIDIEDRPRNGRKYRKIDLVTTALYNVHSSEHCSNCFKKGNECRMKLPQKECFDGQIIFDEEETDWHTWQGDIQRRKLFLYENKRSHFDSHVNVHSEIASHVFGCNTNVVTCVDGGSVMYITCYISKNTQKDDEKTYVETLRRVVKWLKRKRERILENNEGDLEIDSIAEGLKILIGASIIATRAYRCSATMAAYLTRNHSRFQFSHRFEYIRFNDLLCENIMDSVVDANKDGTPYIKSRVGNYLHRSKKLDDVCVYDVLSYYSTRKKSNEEVVESLELLENHQVSESQKYVELILRKDGRESIPSIGYMSFVDTKNFGGHNILDCDLNECNEKELSAMENYARIASILFIPFRNLKDLQSEDGRFLEKFRQWMLNPPEIFKSRHSLMLKNLQDCRNSIRVGRPKDALERITLIPEMDVSGVNNEMDHDEDPMEACYEELIFDYEDNEDCIGNYDNFRDGNSRLSIETSTIRNSGVYGCGTNLISSPIIDGRISIETAIDDNSDQRKKVNHMKQSDLYYFRSREEKIRNRIELFRLHTQIRSRHTGQLSRQNISPNGTISNMIEYGNNVLRNDWCQVRAFVLITSAFVLELYKIPELPTTRVEINLLKNLKKLHKTQFVGLLSGPGGTGKSRVISAVLGYCKGLCERIRMPFHSRTIVVTAMTGAAAVNIRGETVHSALNFRRDKKILQPTIEEIRDWKDTLLFIVDEISFCNEETFRDINNKLNKLKETQGQIFGGIPTLFVGDFTQLDPVHGQPLYKNFDNELFYEGINTLMELETNHRFDADPDHGTMLKKMRISKLTSVELDAINKRVVCPENDLYEKDIPHDVVYATVTNKDKAAINDAIFARHLSETHSMNPEVTVPDHTICIKASNLMFKKRGQKEYVSTGRVSKTTDIIYASCSDANVSSRSKTKRTDPLLKLFVGRPLCINENIDVSRCIANGAQCKFKGIVFKKGIDTAVAMEKILIDGFFVNCVECCHLKYLVVEMIDGAEGNVPKIVYLQPQTVCTTVKYPIPWEGPITSKTRRIDMKVKMTQFPVNIANAITVHKLQGRSVNSIVVSSWMNKGNWIYVVLSRCVTRRGIYLRRPLKDTFPMSEECAVFYNTFRNKKEAPGELERFRYLEGMLREYM